MDKADVALIWLTVKDNVKDFVEKTSANVNASRKEADNVRFDCYQCADKPSTYVLYEVFKTEAAAANHKEQEHFKEWKPWITESLAENGRERRQYRVHGGKGLSGFRGGDVSPDNVTTLVHCFCKPGTEEKFAEATKKNQAGVLKNEPNALRFDILQDKEDPTLFILVEVFKDADALSYHGTMQHFLDWRTEVADFMDKPRNGEKIKIQLIGEKNAVMKLTAKKSAGFYARAATTFLHGAGDRPPVEELTLSALGDAVGTAGAVAAELQREGKATITKITTDYPEVGSGDKAHPCAQIQVVMKPSK